MQIFGFGKYLDEEEVQDHDLKDCSVIIDGNYFFNHLCEKYGIQLMYGCEADRYASCIRKYFEKFKEANIRCYCMFKGGSFEKKYKLKRFTERYESRYKNQKVYPVIGKELVKQVLDDIGIEYAVCEFGSKSEIISFAKKNNCFIISYDIEFCFTGVPYIPYPTISVSSDGVKCGLFDLRKFLEKFNLTKQQLAIFIVLTNERLFGREYFLPLFESLNMSKSPIRRYMSLLKWLGRLPVQRCLNIIFKYVKKADFEEKLQDVENFLYSGQRPGEIIGLPTKYIENKMKMEFTELDPAWFIKGVAMGKIAVNYVNLYHHSIYYGSWAIEDTDSDDSLICSLDIITYAFNLLTNFEKDDFTFYDKRFQMRRVSSKIASYGAVQKPKYDAVDSPFENGWEKIESLRLFEHFLGESLQGFNSAALEQAPEDAKLLIIALVYFTRKKSTDTNNLACSILISYVMLNVVFEKLPEKMHVNVTELTKKPYLDSNLAKESVIVRDCAIANNIVDKYFCLTTSESHCIFKPKLLHPFVEFQHCLVQLNNLNILCGSSYKPTKYSKTFNSTFVYKFLLDAESNKYGNGKKFVQNILNPAASVLAYFNGLFELYEKVLYL